MEAWEKDQEVPEESLVNFMGDPYGYVTEALDMKLTHSGPESVGLVGRCKRFVVYFEDGVARLVRIAESDEVCLFASGCVVIILSITLDFVVLYVFPVLLFNQSFLFYPFNIDLFFCCSLLFGLYSFILVFVLFLWRLV